MDFLRTLKKRKPKKHARAAGDRQSRGIRVRRRGRTLNLGVCFALFLGLAVVTQGQAEDYYIYQGPNGGLLSLWNFLIGHTGQLLYDLLPGGGSLFEITNPPLGPW